jgi:hypothetical protein
LKIKKIVIKKTGTKCEGKKNWRGWFDFLKGWHWIWGRERGGRKKEKWSLAQITGMSGPSCKGCQNLSNIFLKVAVSGWTALHA